MCSREMMGIPISVVFQPEMMVEEEEAPKQTRTRRNNEPAFAKDAVSLSLF